MLIVRISIYLIDLAKPKSGAPERDNYKGKKGFAILGSETQNMINFVHVIVQHVVLLFSDEVFVISRIIKVEVNVGVISPSRRPRLIILTKTLIILDITNTESIIIVLLYIKGKTDGKQHKAQTWHDYP